MSEQAFPEALDLGMRKPVTDNLRNRKSGLQPEAASYSDVFAATCAAHLVTIRPGKPSYVGVGNNLR